MIYSDATFIPESNTIQVDSTPASSPVVSTRKSVFDFAALKARLDQETDNSFVEEVCSTLIHLESNP